MIRLVVDPGVFISALVGGRGGAPDLVVRALVDDRIEVIASPLLTAELEGVLRRPKSPDTSTSGLSGSSSPACRGT